MRRALRAIVSSLSVAGLATALAGCTMGPEFVSPVSRLAESPSFLPTGYRVRSPLPVLKNTVPAAPEAEWWRMFRDPELVRLEAQVASQNLDVLTATARLEESRAQLGTAAAAALPTVNGSDTFYHEKFSQNGIISLGIIPGAGATGTGSGGAGGGSQTAGSKAASSPFNDQTVGFDASWELDLWGRVRRSIEASQAQVDSSAESRRDTLVSTLAELARDYVQLRPTQLDVVPGKFGQCRNERVATGLGG